MSAEAYLEELQSFPAPLKAQVQSAIEISEALTGLTVAVNDMANRVVTVANNLQETMKTASAESTQAAKESAAVASKLNLLTRWIIATAFFSAIAACIQAGVALYAILRPTHKRSLFLNFNAELGHFTIPKSPLNTTRAPALWPAAAGLAFISLLRRTTPLNLIHQSEPLFRLDQGNF